MAEKLFRYFFREKPRMSAEENKALKVDRILNKVIHLLGVLHLLVSPYTKVEESFNLQVNNMLQSFLQHLPSLWGTSVTDPDP